MGSIRLGLLIEKDMHRKVAMIRRVMKILDRDRISGYIPFAGVMFLEGKKLNDALKKMENIEHTDWQPARTQTPVLSTQIVKSLNDFIKDCLEKLISKVQG